MAVIYLRIDTQEKRELELKAKELGMQLTTYCRMLLLTMLHNNKKEEQNVLDK